MVVGRGEVEIYTSLNLSHDFHGLGVDNRVDAAICRFVKKRPASIIDERRPEFTI